MATNLLYQDHDFIAVQKPQGIHVVPPECPQLRRQHPNNLLKQVSVELGLYLYPVHRLDFATEGIVLFALHKEAARKMNQQLAQGIIEKKYQAIVRGYMPESVSILKPLKLDSSDKIVKSLTSAYKVQTWELPFAVGKRHQTSRYSLVEAFPKTGRYHQIRRHLDCIGHPIVGDAYHGDLYHNRFFKEKLDLPGLWLRSYELNFKHPQNGSDIRIQLPESQRWQEALSRLTQSAIS